MRTKSSSPNGSQARLPRITKQRTKTDAHSGLLPGFPVVRPARIRPASRFLRAPTAQTKAASRATSWQCASMSPALAGIAAFLKARLLRERSGGPHAGRAGGHRAGQRPSTKPPRAARKRRRGGSEDCLSPRSGRVLDRAPGKRAGGSFSARSGKLQLSPGQFLCCRAGATSG